MDDGVKLKGMTAPAIVPIQDPDIDQSHRFSLEQNSGGQLQVPHDQSLLLLPAPGKTIKCARAREQNQIPPVARAGRFGHSVQDWRKSLLLSKASTVAVFYSLGVPSGVHRGLARGWLLVSGTRSGASLASRGREGGRFDLSPVVRRRQRSIASLKRRTISDLGQTAALLQRSIHKAKLRICLTAAYMMASSPQDFVRTCPMMYAGLELVRRHAFATGDGPVTGGLPEALGLDARSLIEGWPASLLNQVRAGRRRHSAARHAPS
jgi:hypothetical protein